MKLHALAVAALAAGFGGTASAQLLSEGFDDVAGLAGQGWVFLSNGSAAGDGWFQGNPGIFEAADGPADSYAAANWVSSAGSISDWLMTPVIDLTPFAGGRSLEFSLRLLGDGFLDRVEVYTSNAGASTDPASFSLLGSYAARSDTSWLTVSLALPAIDGRIGFRYVVADTAVAGNYVGIDSVSVVPEPATWGLMGLGLAAVLAARRRRES